MSWDPRTPSGLRLWLPTAYKAGMWTEDNSGYAHTQVASSGDNVGQIDDPSQSAHRIYAGSSGIRPTFSTANGHNASLLFATSGMTVENSKKAFKFITNSSPTYTIGVWVYINSFGAVSTVMDAAVSTSSNVGCTLLVNTTGTVQWVVEVGSGNAVNVTSTATITISTWTYVEINCNAGSGTLNVGGTTKSFSHSGGTTNDWSYTLEIGRRASSGANNFRGQMADLFIADTNWGSTDLTSYQSYNPSPTSSTLAQQITGGTSVAATALSHLHISYDGSNAGTLWKDTAQTSAVTTNTDLVASMDHAVSATSGSSYNRAAQQATSGNRPAYSTNFNSTSNSALLYTGANNDNLAFLNTLYCNGACTIFIVVKASSVSGKGVHVIEGAEYLTLTDPTYASNDSAHGGPGGPFSVCHTSSGTATNFLIQPNPLGAQIIELTRQGNAFATWINGHPAVPITIASLLTFSNIGTPYIAGWDFNGYWCEMAMYTTRHSATACDNLRRGLASKWNVPGVIYGASAPWWDFPRGAGDPFGCMGLRR